jgi:hypothetical protein
MKPLVYSQKEAEQNNIGWYRDGYNIAYYQNQRKRKAPSGGGGQPSNLPTNAYTGNQSIPSCANVAAASSSNYGPHYYSLTFEVLFKRKFL